MEMRNNYEGLEEELEIPLLHHKQIGGYAWNKKVYDAVPVFLYGYTGNLVHPYRVISRGLGTARFEHFSVLDPRIDEPVKKDGDK